MNFDNKQQSLITFRVGSILCCAPCFYVKSIITPPRKITKLPGSTKAQPGIFKHGSHIVKVIDLRQKFGVAEIPETGSLIIIIFNNESFSFWVDQIIDVFDFPSKGWSGLPAGIPRDVFSSTLVLNKNIHLYTEFEKLIAVEELSYFKNNTQQHKKESNADDKEIKNNVVESKKTETPFIKAEENITKQSTQRNLKTHSVITNTKKPDHQAKNILEQNTIKTRPLVENNNKEHLEIQTSVKPKVPLGIKAEHNKTICPIVENDESQEDESSSSIFSIVIIFFILLISAISYYLYSSDPDLNAKQKNKSVTTNIIEDTKIYDEPLDRPVETMKPITPPLVVEPKPNNEKIITIKEDMTSHHAEIKKEKKEVVITVYTPKPVNKKIKPVIVHTVIKGDTLWAITKKYINNPFRYSELAALNKIENPHRIYPGDRVQIRFIQK